MSHPHTRPSRWAAAGAATFVLLIPLLFLGCDSRKPPTGAGPKTAGVAKDSDANALATLESTPDAAHCRNVLQQLDAADGGGNRPILSESERTELATFLQLTQTEAGEISKSTFTELDAAYLEECLLVRAGMRALKIDDRPPLERGRVAFEWVCRQVYVDSRIPWPANPWSTLQGGSGVALSRAYVVLAAWQQLGLDGCFVGPPVLKTTVSSTPPTEQAPSIYAPVRACGLRDGADVFLFDPTSGLPFLAADGKSILTLAQAREKPETVKGFSADEVKSWQPFLAPSLSSLSKRMEWLDERNPANSGVKLFVNVLAQRAKFGGASCQSWNPDGDIFTATRVLGRYTTDDSTSKNTVALRDAHRVNMTPVDRMPKTNLDGRLGSEIAGAYLSSFAALRYSVVSPRDLMLRGKYSEAMSSLSDTREVVENARDRWQQDANLKKDFQAWATQLQTLSARALRPDPSDPGGVQAARELQVFRGSARSRDIERAFILGNAARPLGAEVTFLMANCVHERAERSQSKEQWKNAAEWWQRFLDASALAQAPFPAREPHAQALLARCQQFAGK